jgi:hypothetical protein
MNLQKSILATLIYHDIFDYPLRFDQINQLLIKSKASESNIKKNLRVLLKQNKVGEHKDLFYLRNRKQTIETRLKRNKISEIKFQRAKYYLNCLKLIPTIKLVAITGALAMENSTKDDDIDFLIISSKKTLWITRFFANVILFPYRRKPKSKKQKNKACLNIFLDESDLKIKDQNLYTAHEMAQLKPIFDRNNTYKKLIKTNSWLNKYLPNWEAEINKHKQRKSFSLSLPAGKANRLALVVDPIEALAKWGQLTYMKSKMTTEKIEDTQLFFHPAPTQNIILEKFNNKMKNLDKLNPTLR